MIVNKILMPKELTAENGAKKLFIGEFYTSITHECAECIDVGPDEECDVCNGNITYEQNVIISWTQIKAIYALAVKHLGEKVDG